MSPNDISRISCRSLPLQRKKNNLVYSLQKNTHPFRCHFAPVWHRASNFELKRFEFGMSVKFYPDPLRLAGVFREKPILSKYITLSYMTAYK